MRTYLFYFKFILFMIKSQFNRIKLNRLMKKSPEEAAIYIEKYVKKWSKFVIDNIPVNIKVEGLENVPEEACLFVGNHQSFVDIPVFVNVFPRTVGFVAKKELATLPIITFWMKAIGCVFIDRENPREGIKSILEGAKNLKEGRSMVIFPEGTRSKSSNMAEFKKGTLKMAQKSGSPIVPVTLDGTYKAYEYDGNKIKNGDVKVIIHKPIYINELTKEEKDNIHVIVHDIIKKDL